MVLFWENIIQIQITSNKWKCFHKCCKSRNSLFIIVIDYFNRKHLLNSNNVGAFTYHQSMSCFKIGLLCIAGLATELFYEKGFASIYFNTFKIGYLPEPKSKFSFVWFRPLFSSFLSLFMGLNAADHGMVLIWEYRIEGIMFNRHIHTVVWDGSILV